MPPVMDEEDALRGIAYILLRRIVRRRRRVRRQYWVHPILSSRLLCGQFYQLHGELQENPEKFFQYYRMSERTFNELLGLVKGGIEKEATRFRLPIPPEERLSITIRYLASGCSYADLHFSYRVGVSTVSGVIKEVCSEIWDSLVDKCMAIPTSEEWTRISDDFLRRTNFPNCIGCVDGKHIRITNPEHGGSLFMNDKHFFSIVLMAICDSNYNFIYVDVGSYGKCNDSGIFNNSTLFRMLSEGNINIPEDKPLPGLECSLPHVIVGDEAFGLSRNVLRPYGGNNPSVYKRVFNYRLSRARRYIECTFGIMTNKWRILHTPLNVSLHSAEIIVKSVCVLHNFVRNRDGFTFEDTLTMQGLVPLASRGRSVRVKQVTDIRDRFSEYFMSPEGELAWQYMKVSC